MTSGLGLARNLIGAALGLGSRLLTSALTGAERLARSALTRVRSALSQVVRQVFAGLRRIADSVLRALQLTIGLQPALSRAESTITNQLGTAERQALTSIKTNREQHLQAVREGRTAADGGDLVDQARHNNATVVTAFSERTGTILARSSPP